MLKTTPTKVSSVGPQRKDAAEASIAPAVESSRLVATLAVRERFRDEYWSQHDPIIRDRLLWRAQTFRHTVHLLPGQTILQLGCGSGLFTRPLLRVTRGENPLTNVTFQRPASDTVIVGEQVEHIAVSDLPGPLTGRQFDCIVAMDMLDGDNSSEFLPVVLDLLAPGGAVVFYESNPWNPVHKLRRGIARLTGRRDPRQLVSRPRLYELFSEIGFIRVYAVYNDFVFAPLTRSLIWWLRNLSILLENAPVISRLAGSILLHAQKPPRKREIAGISLAEHASLRGAVSVVIPCRNEEMNIGRLIPRLLDLYGDYVHEILPVDDGSSDRTREVMSELAAKDARVKPVFRQPPNGVGRAIAEGLRVSTGRFVLTMDCDFEHLLPELRDLFDAAAEGYDVVIGSRFSRHSVLLNYPFMKIFANRAFHILARVVLGHTVRDTTNNLKLLRREVVDNLQLLQPGFAVNAETGIQPWLMGYKVREMPISWINRTPGMGTSSFRLVRVGGGYWQVLWGLWLRRAFGRGPYRNLASRRVHGSASGSAGSAPTRSIEP
jgi:dolichol-phosphate mannosyltransferase